MKLIEHRGLNCYQACLVSVADALGVAWLDVFATLWSETDFDEDARCPLFVTRRLYANLLALGMRVDALICASPAQAEAGVAAIPAGEPFIVGMDLFDVPWSPVRGFGRGPHYFFAHEGEAGEILCFDPTYRREGERMERLELAAHAGEICRVHITETTPPPIDLAREARAVLLGHPDLERELLGEIERCRVAGRKCIDLLIRRIAAMINNRRLFALFMQSRPGVPGQARFDEAFLARWEAVKNGLYMASIVGDNTRVLGEVRGLLESLIREEIGIAQEMLAIGVARQSS